MAQTPLMGRKALNISNWFGKKPAKTVMVIRANINDTIRYTAKDVRILVLVSRSTIAVKIL